jgi:predicted ATPase
MAMTRQQAQEEGKEMDPILKALSLPPLPPLSSRSKVPCFRSASIGVSSNLRRLSYTGSLASQSSDNLTAWRELRLGEILCQREREEELLQQAFQRIQQAQHFDTRKDSGAGDLMPPSQIVLVRGAEAGLGQTTLVSRLRQQVQSQKGVVLSISCERGGNPNPHANVVRALRKWAQDASEGVDNPGGVWHRLGKSLTVEESAFLSHVVPEIQTLLGRMTCTTTPSYSSKQRVSLFKVAFCKLVYELAAQRPCVVLVQDLHESDEVTLDLWRALVRAEDMRDYERPFLFVGTYRPTLRPLESLSEQFQRAHKTQVTHISLEPFGPDETKQRLLKLIDVGTHAVLQELVARSRGIPFYLMQLLEGLIVAGELEYDTHARVWRLSGGRIEFPTTSQLIGLDELPAETLLFLRIFSSLGTRTSRFLLERSRSSDSLDHDLELATGSGILVKREEGAYAFAHEAIREMVYESISVDQRLLFHKQIAENLWLSFDLDELDHYLLILVNQLVACRDTLSSQATRAAVAHLCLRAGERSAEVSAYHTSYHYLTVGMELLGINGWENSYDVCLALNSAACEVAYCVSKYEDIHRFADDTIAEAKSFTDSLRVQITKIYAIGTNEDPSKSLEYGNILLERLGEAVGTAPKQQQADAAIRRILRRLQGCTDGHILRLSSMEDADKLAAMQILNCYVPYVFAVDHHLAPIVVERMIALTLDYGISALSGVGFAYLGTVLCW